MTPEAYKATFSEDDAVGWLAIDQALEKVYGQQKPRHFAPALHYMVGGSDPLDGISIYDSNHHLHIVSYGMSELYYNLESASSEYSKWGFEFTFRLKPFAADNGDPGWAMQMMNNLARYVFSSKKWFEAYHFIPANGPIRLGTDTDIVGVAFVPDVELGTIDTPNGNVSFLQMVGLTTRELERLKAHPYTGEVEKLIAEMREGNPYLITDLERRSQ